MSWTAPRTWVDEEVVTAAQFNAHLRDNENYLKDKADSLCEAVLASPSRSLGTEYQNGSKPRIITVSVGATSSSAGAYVTLTVKVKASSPADTIILKNQSHQYSNNYDCRCLVSCIVPADYYYKVEEAHSNTGSVVIAYWSEWDLY